MRIFMIGRTGFRDAQVLRPLSRSLSRSNRPHSNDSVVRVIIYRTCSKHIAIIAMNPRTLRRNLFG
jgi:hypothetical protein